MSLIGFLLEALMELAMSPLYPTLSMSKPSSVPPSPIPQPAIPPSPPPSRNGLLPKFQYVGPRVAVLGSSECQVCGEALKGGLVACPSCATLSHEGCWVYARGCSTYGCENRG